MTKIYLVKETHDYDLQYVIGACQSRELAEKFAQKNRNKWDLEDCEITSEMWDKMLSHVYSKGIPSWQSLEEAMIETYPEYSVSDITRSCGEYMNRSYLGTVIEEIDLFTNDADIAMYGIDH